MSDTSAGGAPPLPTGEPPPSVVENFFSATDLGPYEVYVENKTNESSIHPMKMGKILLDNKITGVINISKKGRNRISIRFNSATSANDFVKAKINTETLNIYIPRHLTSCQGVIRNIDTSFSLEDIIANIRSVKQVIAARRLNRRVKEGEEVKYEPTKTVVLTFKGSMLPKTVSLYYVTLEVRTYILPVVRCTKCLRFGHNAKACKGTERCRNCGGEPHPDRVCDTKCIHCGENHNALFPECRELKRQQNIKQLMAFENITFFEAAKKIPRLETSSNAAATSDNTSVNNNLLHRPQLFPHISTEQFNNDSPYNYYRTTQGRSYANITQTSTGAKKKRTLSPGYDKAAVNNLLWFPNGNASPCERSNVSYASTPNNNSPVTENVFTPDQLNQLKKLVDLFPTPDEAFKIVYSTLAQAKSSSSNNTNNNGEQHYSMEC